MSDKLSYVAQGLLDVVPPIMHFIREEMRRQSAGANALSIPQFRCLAFLRRNPGAAVTKVAVHQGITKATASDIVERLVQQGLVNRQIDPTERRRHRLTLTPAGDQVLDDARKATREQVKAVLNRLSPAELVTLADALPLLTSAFQEVLPPNL
ncbi:MAG: MarR family transcriptional regulator [Kiritimatiellia bacterium]